MILTCIVQMTNDVQHLLMCLLGLCTSPLEKYYFKSSPTFNEAFHFLLLSYKSFSNTVDIGPLSNKDLQIFLSILWVF